MGLIWNRRRRIAPGTSLNVSRSGASVSRRAGPFTVSPRGRVSLRLGKGFRWRV